EGHACRRDRARPAGHRQRSRNVRDDRHAVVGPHQCHRRVDARLGIPLPWTFDARAYWPDRTAHLFRAAAGKTVLYAVHDQGLDFEGRTRNSPRSGALGTRKNLLTEVHSRAICALAVTLETYSVNELLQAKIDVFESGYEFLLAYAAQGRDSDGGPGSEVRTMLNDMSEAAVEIVHLLEKNESAYGWVVADDARKAQAAISLVLAQAEISSELVDNLNVSIHLRALLTDLFLVSETDL